MKGHKGHHHRKAGGGVKESKPKVNKLDPESPVNEEAEKTSDTFKKGGKVRGKKGAKRLDRKPRKSGGRCMAGGGSVLSGASVTSSPKGGKSKGAEDKEDD
jgi:hypothetical protein